MEARIETLRAKNSDGQEYQVYPRTLIKCVTNENGDSFEDAVKELIEQNSGSGSNIVLDEALDETSENGVQNKAVATAINDIKSDLEDVLRIESDSGEDVEIIPLDADTLNGFGADAFVKVEDLSSASVDNADKLDGHGVDHFATKSTTIDTTLLASNWVGTEAPYTYTIEIDEVTEDSIVEVITPSVITPEQIEGFQLAQILNGSQTVGSITLNAWGEISEVDLPITIIVRGD